MVVQLKASEIVIRDLFKDLLIELKGFKHQITLLVLLSRVKSREYTEYKPVYFNSLTKTVIGDKYFLDKYFNVIIFRLENWLSHGSGWIVEEIVSQYLNLSGYLPLSGSTYVKLPKELSHLMKGLMNIQNNDNKCFLWCHFRHLNCKGVKLSIITKKDRKIGKSTGINVPVSKKDYDKIGVMNEINVNILCYEDKVIYPIHLSDQSFSDTSDLLLITNHYVYIKDFNRLMFNKNKCKNKKWFCKSCLQCFSREKVLLEHGRDCLLINGGQRVKLEKEFIEFKNCNKQIPAPLKAYADFECLLKSCNSGIINDCFSYTSKYQDHVPCSFAYKLVCVNDKCSKDVGFKFIQCIFKEYNYCKDVRKKYFNKNLVMTAEQNEEFERSNICWICGKLIEIGDNKVRDHGHTKEGNNHRGTAHWSRNINLKVIKKMFVIFHNLKGYDSHLMFKELSKFNCGISVIPNGLEKYMSFTLGRNIVFIASMLFLNSSLDKLVSNLGSEDFKHLSEVFKGEKLELVKKKGVYPYEYFNSFKKFDKSKLPDIDCFFF